MKRQSPERLKTIEKRFGRISTDWFGSQSRRCRMHSWMRTNNDLKRIGDSSPNPGGRQLSGWGLGYGAGRSQAQTYFHNKMGHSAVHEHLQTLRRWYKVKRREAPPSQPTCSSGALWLVGCFGCIKSRLSSVIAQKQMCAKYRTLLSLMLFNDYFKSKIIFCSKNNLALID